MVYGGGLENRWALKGSAGSNPALTACLRLTAAAMALMGYWYMEMILF